MNVKNILNFKMLRDKGASSLEIKDDEVVQLSTKNGILCVVTQEFLLQLLDAQSEKKLGVMGMMKDFSPSQTDIKFGRGLRSSGLLGSNFVGAAIPNNESPSIEARVENLEKLMTEVLKKK